MSKQQHFNQIDIQTELRWRICDIAQELDELRSSGESITTISATDLFYLEALGYQVDLTTGSVERTQGHQCSQQTPEECVATSG